MSRRLKRLSADLPRNWLFATRYRNLSDRAWRLHTHALMWAIGETDGLIGEDFLPLLVSGDWHEQRKPVDELVKARLWDRVTGGWQLTDWEASQSTVEQIEANRAAVRKRVARFRERQRGQDEVTP
jgi:hypothetical protein